MNEWIYDGLRNISWLTYLASILSLLIFSSKSKVLMTKLLLFYLIIGIIAEISIEMILNYGIATNIPIVLYTILVTPLLLLIYYSQIKQKRIRQLILILSAGLLPLELVWFVKNFQMIMADIFYLPLIITCIMLSLVYLFEQFKRLEIPDLTKHFFFWVNSALMIYFGMGYFLYIFENIIRSDEVLFAYTWPIQLISTIIMNLVIAFGAWKTRPI